MMPNTEIASKQNTVKKVPPTVSKLNHQPAHSSVHQQPRLFTDQPAHRPRLFAEVVKSSRSHFDSVDPETMLKVLNTYEMIRQS